MRILNILFLFLSLNLLSQEQLSDTEVTEFQETMMAKANALETLQADFIQTKKIEMMMEEAVSRGRLYYQYPEKLKWEYSEPKDFTILLMEDQLYIDDAGEKSVRTRGSSKLLDKIGQLITSSVNGKLLQDNRNFNISYYKNNKNISAVIIPKDEHLKQMFSEIRMQFNHEDIVEKVILVEASGDTTGIEFSQIQLNKDIPNSVFQP